MASLNPLQGVLGQRRAAHLLRRISFRYSRTKVDELAGQTAADALDALLQVHPLQLDQPVYADSPGASPATWINPPQPPDAQMPAEEDILRRYVMAWWLNEALHDPGGAHRLSFFFHQFLAVTPDYGTSMEFYDYLMLLRWGCLGNFKQLVTKMVVDNCMLEYIDNDQNFVNNPNENYAREFFELHTIGAGPTAGPGDYTNYTEEDIIQAARVLTGFNHADRDEYQDPDTGIPAGRGYPQSHDFQPKTFSARFNGTVIQPPSNNEAGMFAELNALVDMVFSQEETARNFCRRLYRFFIRRPIDTEVETDIIGPLAQTFIANNFEILPVVDQLLQSEHFYDADDADSLDENLGALIKSPLDLALQTLSFFGLPIPDPMTETQEHYETLYDKGIMGRLMDWAGMFMFYPPDVAGYPGYYQDPDFNRQFFNSATIVSRYKWPEMLLSGTHAWGPGADEPLGTKFNFAAWLRDSGVISDPADSYVLVQELLRYLFPEEPDSERFDYFLTTIFLNGLPPADWTYEWQNFIASGDDFEVQIPLGRLFNAMLYAPEYQVG
ncbi:MAG: DUF1800 family protein [Bacteroidetes bacterium]|nr:MAG: DUF1800 family protein [Bacteroidota bacterium]